MFTVATTSWVSVVQNSEQRGEVMPRNSAYVNTLHNVKWLEEHYVQSRESASELARRLGTSTNYVTRCLHQKGIPVRDGTSARKMQSSEPSKYRGTLYNKEWLEDRYVNMGMSQQQIAHCVPCSRSAVARALFALGLVTEGKKTKRISDPGLRSLAREMCPSSRCAVCGSKETGVHHKDHNVWNLAQSNLERLCQPHHVMQHNFEACAALHMTRGTREGGRAWRGLALRRALLAGFSLSAVYNAGRKLLLDTLEKCSA